MIDINKIKTGDCLIRTKDGVTTACFVLFPNMQYNVCVRHAFECTDRRIRVLNNLQQADQRCRSVKHRRLDVLFAEDIRQRLHFSVPRQGPTIHAQHEERGGMMNWEDTH